MDLNMNFMTYGLMRKANPQVYLLLFKNDIKIV